MSCAGYDWKGYALNELTAEEKARAEQHLAGCEACRAEAGGYTLTLAAMARLPEQAPPRRIAFVSDPVLQPNWWQRFWASGPRLGFVSAAMLAGAIVVHGFVMRPSGPALVAQGDSQVLEAKVEQEVARRLPAAVDARVSEQLRPAMAELAKKLDEAQKSEMAKVRHEVKGKADLREVRSAFEYMEKQMSARYLSAARFGGD